jgi:hypothetical protein
MPLAPLFRPNDGHGVSDRFPHDRFAHDRFPHADGDCSTMAEL